jgi:hypothetical protein
MSCRTPIWITCFVYGKNYIAIVVASSWHRLTTNHAQKSFLCQHASGSVLYITLQFLPGTPLALLLLACHESYISEEFFF